MRPLLVELVVPGLGVVAVTSWTAMLLLAIGLGLLVATREARRGGDDPRALLRVLAIAVLAGLVGGRLGHLLTASRALYLADPARLLRVWEGGMVLLGGIGLGIPAGVLSARRAGLSAARAADAAAPGVALGVAVGRLGCLLAGCCYGHPIEYGTGIEWPFGVVFLAGQVPDVLRGVPLHPTQLYESLGALVLFVALRRLRARQSFDGQVAAVAAMAYGTLRPAIELLRLDAERGFVLPTLLGDAVSTSQALALPLLLGGAVAWRVGRQVARQEGFLGLGPAEARSARRRGAVAQAARAFDGSGSGSAPGEGSGPT